MVFWGFISLVEEEEDNFEFYNLLYTLALENRTIYELSDSEYELISVLSIKYTEAGRGALVILNIIAGKPIDITCEMTGTCEEERWANQNIQTASISSKSEKSEIINRPNPFSIETKITIPDSFKNDITIFEIFDTNGKLIQSKNISKNESELVVTADDLNNGIYFYQFKSKMNMSPKGKMIVIK